MGNNVSHSLRAKAPIFLARREDSDDVALLDGCDASLSITLEKTLSSDRLNSANSRFIPAGFYSLYHTEIVVLLEDSNIEPEESKDLLILKAMIKPLVRVEATNVRKCRLAILKKRPLYGIASEGNANETIADFRSRSIVEVMPDLAFFQGLLSLRLDHNDIEFLPEEFGLLKNLQELNLARNKLKVLPTSIGMLADLKEADISWNQLKELPESIWNLKKLSVLNISFNEIHEISRGVGALDNLKSLDAHSNRLELLPIELNQLKHLKRLQIHGNPLIPEHNFKAVEARLTQNNWDLRELAMRRYLETQAVGIQKLPILVHAHVQRAQICSFCGRPLINVQFVRIRKVQRHGQSYPFYYVLCSSHWRRERDRIRTLFQDHTPARNPEVRRFHRNRQVSYWETYVQSSKKANIQKCFNRGTRQLNTPRLPAYDVEASQFQQVSDKGENHVELSFVLTSWNDIPTIVINPLQ